MYYIYHIPQVKIGCTTNPKNRVKQQGYTHYEILETHTDIQLASEREIELQKIYGYKVDTCTYYDSIKRNAKKQNIAGRISATKQWKENRDRELKKCSKGGKANAEKNGKPVIMCDMNGNPLKSFQNRKQAADFVKGFKSVIISVIDKPTKSYKGYKWISPEQEYN